MAAIPLASTEFRGLGVQMSGTFSVGDVISQSARVYVRNLPAFGFLSMLSVLPVIFHILTVEPSDTAARSVENVAMLCHHVLGSIVTAAVTYGVVMQLGGKRAPFLSCVGTGLARALPVLGVSIGVSVLTLLGLMVLIVPGVIVACMYFVAIPVAVVERGRNGPSLERSAALTKGVRWRILWLGLTTFAFIMAVNMAAYWLIVPAEYETWAAWRGDAVVIELFAAFMAAYWSVTVAVAYHALRRSREGVSAEDLAAVFE